MALQIKHWVSKTKSDGTAIIRWTLEDDSIAGLYSSGKFSYDFNTGDDWATHKTAIEVKINNKDGMSS